MYAGIIEHIYPAFVDCVLLAACGNYSSNIISRAVAWEIRAFHHDTRYVQVNVNNHQTPYNTHILCVNYACRTDRAPFAVLQIRKKKNLNFRVNWVFCLFCGRPENAVSCWFNVWTVRKHICQTKHIHSHTHEQPVQINTKSKHKQKWYIK